jgi:hypothetical protein
MALDGPPADAFAYLVSRLVELGVEIDKQDGRQREITVRFLSSCADAFFWRCWSDRLLFKLEDGEHGNTLIRVFALPNLWRLSVRQGETVGSPAALLSSLRRS